MPVSNKLMEGPVRAPAARDAVAIPPAQFPDWRRPLQADEGDPTAPKICDDREFQGQDKDGQWNWD